MMPIIIKDFQWSQNGEWVFIVLDIKSVRAGSTDVISSPTYLKVHCPPYIFEAFLHCEVDDTLGECTIDEKAGKVSFRLKKAIPGVSWEQLENKGLTREEKSGRRAEAIQVTHQRHEKEKIERHKRRFDRKQTTIHDQLRIDEESRERITKLKTSEGEKAVAELNEWASSSDSVSDTHTKPSNDAICLKTGNYIPTLWTAGEVSAENDGDGVSVRSTFCFSVNFTQREFPTPMRESTRVAEQEWLKKQAEARRLSGFVDEDLRPEERNPQWLLDKGLSLLRTESYLGAISAFSLGIRLAPKMPELYVERARAHLAVKNYHRTVEDCSQGIELLTPKVQGNEEDRLKCHICRGDAFRALEMWEEALADYKEGIRLQPKNNEELTLVHDEIQEALQNCAQEKEKGTNERESERNNSSNCS